VIFPEKPDSFVWKNRTFVWKNQTKQVLDIRPTREKRGLCFYSGIPLEIILKRK